MGKILRLTTELDKRAFINSSSVKYNEILKLQPSWPWYDCPKDLLPSISPPVVLVAITLSFALKTGIDIQVRCRTWVDGKSFAHLFVP